MTASDEAALRARLDLRAEDAARHAGLSRAQFAAGVGQLPIVIAHVPPTLRTGLLFVGLTAERAQEEFARTYGVPPQKTVRSGRALWLGPIPTAAFSPMTAPAPDGAGQVQSA